MTGKEKCEILKAMRKEIAEANDIVYLSSECIFKGDCLGYCPKCDAEARYLDAELNRLAKEGKEIKISGLTYKKFLATAESVIVSNEKSTDDELIIEGQEDFRKEYVLGITVEELEFSPKTYQCLKKAEIHTIENLTDLSLQKLGMIDGLGEQELAEITQKLSTLGLTLNDEDLFIVMGEDYEFPFRGDDVDTF